MTFAARVLSNIVPGVPGTPVLLGTQGSASSVTTNIITTSANAPASQLIVLFNGTAPTINTITSATDQVSNSYIAGTNISVGAGTFVNAKPFYSEGINHLPSGDTITAAVGGGGAFTCSVAATVPNVPSSGSLDNQGGGDSSLTATSLSLTEGTVTSPNRVVFGYVYVKASVTGMSAAGGAWNPLGSATDANGATLYVFHQIISGSLSAVTFHPSWTTPRDAVANTISFQ